MKKIHWILIGVIVLAAVLRLSMLGMIPLSLDWDETSLGYNAYSLLTTGRDEYGAFMPVNLQSFDDFKPALYSYLLIPVIKLFGLNPFAVRLPSAIMGIIGVIAVYYFVKELFAEKPLTRFRIGLAEISAFVMAVMPVAIHFSRVAFEAQSAAVLNILGALFFLKGTKKYPYLLLSITFFVLGMYMYQSEKVFVPLLVILLLVVYRKHVRKISRSWVAYSMILGLVLSVPFVQSLFTQNSLSRAQGVSIFNHSYESIQNSSVRSMYDRQAHDVLGLVIDNSRVEYVKIAVANYLSHMNPTWFFVTGDSIQRHQAPGFGHAYLWMLPFLLIGLYWLVFHNRRKEATYILIGWLLLAPLAASITWDVPNIVRTLNVIPVVPIIISIGLWSSFEWVLKKGVIAKTASLLVVLIIIVQFAYYLDQYFVQYNRISGFDWQPGYKDAISYIQQHKDSYKKIVVSDKAPLDQSYIFFLFYLAYPPQQYQKDIQAYAAGEDQQRTFDKYTFGLPEKIEAGDEKVLYVGSPSEFSDDSHVVYTVKNPDGTIAIELVEK